MRNATIGLIAVSVMFAPVQMVYADFDNPNYTYTKILNVGPLVDTMESQISWDGTKILWNEREKDPTGSFYVRKSVKYGDWNSTTKTISNVVTVAEVSNSEGIGNNTANYGKWSPDGNYIAYGYYNAGTGENTIKRYKLSDGTTSVMYDPAAGVDWGNFDFHGNNDSLVFWDRNPSHSNYGDLYTWNGATRSNLTNTANYKEYEPRVYGSDTSQVLYWSGEEATHEPYRSIHILNSDSSVTDVALGTADHNYFWPVWGKDQSHIGVVDHGSSLWNGDLLLYEKVGDAWQFAEDLTGDGYEGESIIFFGSFDSAGSFCFQFEELDGSRDLYFGQVPEPATMSLLAIGGIGVLARRRRRSK